MARVELEAKLRIGGLESADPELLELAAQGFGADRVPAESIGVMSGALDAIERVLEAHLRPGDRVLVEDPTYASIRDLLLALGLDPVAVPIDDFGPIPDEFEKALATGIDALITVPRAQNPFGAALDSGRARHLRSLLERNHDVLLIEDDHASIVSGAPYHTLVSESSRRWAVVRSVSKILHPDLRLAIVAGDETTIARMEGRQALGPRWVSHLLQAVVVALLGDPAFEHIAAHARDAYTTRREALLAALSEHGIAAHGRSGLNVWVPVREEAPVLSGLLEHGWLALAGEGFRINAPPGLRITVAELDERDAPRIAEIIASVEHAGRARRSY